MVIGVTLSRVEGTAMSVLLLLGQGNCGAHR